jgi:UV damage endonuclease UvdE
MNNIITIGKIGFACKWIDNANQVDGIGPKDDARKYSTGTTTIAWLSRQSIDIAEQKLYDLVKQNLQNTLNLVIKVSTLPIGLRMVRLSSEILPVYTHADWSYFYKRVDVIQLMEYYFSKIGEVARTASVRLSFHPGQFTVLASENPGIVNNSIAEFEYHADMARWMGYGKTFQDFKINVHISGKLGPAGIRAAYKRLSLEARNCITIENEENSWGLDDCLELADLLPIVLDVHHHWCREGEWLDPNDIRVKRVIESWRGVRPTMHYSQSREDYLVDHDTTKQPDMNLLKDKGYKKQKLRAHSDFYWNTATNDWVLGYLPTHDIMCESKAKNLSSFALYDASRQIST